MLCATLFRPAEPIAKGQLADRGAEFLAECKRRDIRVIVTVGTQALRAVSPVVGASRKLVGATIQGAPGEPTIIPVDTHWGGIRQFRSFAWIQAMARYVRRGLAMAAGKGHMYQPPRVVTGEGPDVELALQQLLDEKLPVGNDVETTGKDWRTDALTAMGLANKHVAVSTPWEPYVSRLYGAQGGLKSARISKMVAQILSDPGIPKLLHNGMFDLSVLGTRNIKVAGPIEDTLLAHKIVYPDLFHNLQFCMSHEFAVHPWKTVFDIERQQRKEGKDWADTSPQPLMVYNGKDAAAECPLWERLQVKLHTMHRGMENYEKLKSLAHVAADMQFKGVAIDLAARNEVAVKAQQRIASIAAHWESLSGGQPISGKGSKKGVDTLFFKVHKAPVLARSRQTEAAQLSSAVLLEYASMEDQPKLAELAWTLFEYRKIKKSFDAFLKPLTSDRVYAQPNVAGTRGSRISYAKPNLQQWSKEKTIISPITKEVVALAENLRHLILPDPGMVLGEHDYNALEVRLVAYAANVDMWRDWLARGVDMHTEHVRLMFGRTVKKNDPLRQITKVLTFARFYNRRKSVGQVLRALKPSMPTLSEMLLLDVFERFDKAVPQIMRWQEGVEESVRKLGYVELPLSGLRQYHDKRRPDINAALSYGIQSTGGDVIHPATLRIVPRLDPERGERIILNVHDALMWQAPPDRVRHVAAIVQEEMEKPVDLWGHRGVVLPVECKVGANWRDLKGLVTG